MNVNFMKKLVFILFLLFPIFVYSRNPFSICKKNLGSCFVKESLILNGIAEYYGKFGAVISLGKTSSVVFVGDNFLNYKVFFIDKDHVILNSFNDNKKLNLDLVV